MTGTGYHLTVTGFAKVQASSSAAGDVANLIGMGQSLFMTPTLSTLSTVPTASRSVVVQAFGFPRVNAQVRRIPTHGPAMAP